MAAIYQMEEETARLRGLDCPRPCLYEGRSDCLRKKHEGSVGKKLVEELYPVKRATRAYEYSRDTVFQVKRVKEYAYVLPDDQRDLVELIKRPSEQRGFKLRIIDATKETVLYRLWKKLEGIKSIPVIVTKRGTRLEAPFSVDDLERFISEPV